MCKTPWRKYEGQAGLRVQEGEKQSCGGPGLGCGDREEGTRKSAGRVNGFGVLR